MNYIKPDWPTPAHIKAYTTVKTSWGGRQPYHDINKGNYTAQHPAYVSESKSLTELLGLPDDPIWITQTHSSIAIEAKPENKENTADASYTTEPNRVCVVMTADCLPILMTNRAGNCVAAIHAGWRGLAAGIIETTLTAIKLPPEEILIWLGPAIGPTKFEVGIDVYEAFIHQHPQSEQAFLPHREGKWLANLYDLARLRLQSLGINQIYGGNFCTFSQEELFFSYRRDKGHTGRMASLIWIEEN